MLTGKKNTAPATTDIATEIKHAVEALPTFALLKAAKAKLESFNAKASSEEEEVARLELILEKEKSGAENTLVNRAMGLLSGRETAARTRDSLEAARERASVTREACVLQARAIRELEAKLGFEVVAAMRQFRQPLVTRIAEGLRTLRAITTEEASIDQALSQTGLRLNGDFGVAFAGLRFDAQWFALQRERGYSV